RWWWRWHGIRRKRHLLTIHIPLSHQSNRPWLFGFVIVTAVSAVLLPGCPRPVALEGCRKDTDCKGTRICERGVCVEPSLPARARGDAGRPRPRRSGEGGAFPAITPEPSAPPAQSMYRGGAAHRGQAEEAAPLRAPRLKWKVETGGAIWGGAAVAQNGTIYVG